MQWPGSKRNVQKLVDEHYGSLYRYAYRLSGSATDAEDLTQETFCQAQAKLGQLREWGCARAWLFSILRNAYLHRMRTHKVENLVSLDGLGDVPDRPPEPLPEIDPEQLQEALNELPEAFRTPLILYYFEDFSYRDIAAQMDVALGTVMSRLARAKAHLRARLTRGEGRGVRDEGREVSGKGKETLRRQTRDEPVLLPLVPSPSPLTPPASPLVSHPAPLMERRANDGL